MVRTSVTSKGQTTIPSDLRRKWKSKRVVWETNADGSATVRPVPEAMSLFGCLKSDIPRDPDEKEAVGDETVATFDKRLAQLPGVKLQAL